MHPLEAFRLRKGLTLSKLAEGLGIKHPHLHRIMRGLGDPSAALVRRIVAFTGGEVTAEDMLRTGMYAPGTDVNDVRGAA